MREYVYYISPDDENRRVTVVILKSGDLISRGVAICNCGDCFSWEKDEFQRKRGLQMARGRAVKALKYGESKPGSKIKNEYAKKAVPEEFKFKCEFDPELTYHEVEIMTPWKKRAA